MRFLVVLSCAATISSTTASSLLRDSTLLGSFPTTDDSIDLDSAPPFDFSSVPFDPNSFPVASNMDAEANSDDTVKLQDLTVEPGDTDFTDLNDETLLTSACDHGQLNRSLRRRNSLCPIRDGINPAVPEKVEPPEKDRIPDYFVRPSRTAPAPKYDLNRAIDDKCPHPEYTERTCCDGPPRENDRKKEADGTTLIYSIINCYPCEYLCLMAVFDQRSNIYVLLVDISSCPPPKDFCCHIVIPSVCNLLSQSQLVSRLN